MGRMNDGIRSTRASASVVQGTVAGVTLAPSLTTAAKGQPPDSAPDSPPRSSPILTVSPSNASARGLAIIVRTCSNGAGGVTPPPTLTPRLRTICVSNGLVSIATRNPHSGQRNVTASEPSSGPSVEWSFIGSSQSRQRNFMVPAFYHCARPEVGGSLVTQGGDVMWESPLVLQGFTDRPRSISIQQSSRMDQRSRLTWKITRGSATA